MNNERSEEVNFLAHPVVVSPSMSSISPTVPFKRQYFEMDTIINKCDHYLTNYPLALEAVVLKFLYKTLLNTQSFVELSKGLCDLLNTDWRIYDNIKQMTAQLLAGGIFTNHANGEFIMLNTVKSCGRTKGNDIHREHFGAIETSKYSF